MAARELPIPTDPDYVIPDVTEAEFMADQVEDAMLLETGAWDDQPDDDEDGEDASTPVSSK